MNGYLIWRGAEPLQHWIENRLCLVWAENEAAADDLFRKALARGRFLEPVEFDLPESLDLAAASGCAGVYILTTGEPRFQPIPEPMPWE